MQVRLTTLCENTAGGIGFTGEWGLSILVEAGGHAVLLDTGFSDSVVRNASVAGVDLSKVDKIVISHGHTDHTGGLRLLLQRLRKRVEVYAHPEMWGKKYIRVVLPGGKDGLFRYVGVPFCREELEGLGASFNLTGEPVWLNEHMVTTGEVPMVTPFEQVDDNMYIKSDAGFVPDTLPGDQSLIVKTDKGLVVVLGCAHRGMVNTMLHAQKITGVEKIYAVVGGTHLIRAQQNQLDESIAALREFGVEKIGVSHCTGLPAAAFLAREFGDKFFFNNAGTVIEL
ncbi:MBL fold metallo-hydrolase [Desulfallas sp. Bu1-1]|uniref:MBL fold metallo-hydrolase n=1 Tax=Desulfallas sp. Bu1-1 TaxID=2787620 RepID=UPI0018A0DCB5|nr:MBL fold metallo-hydrolase [Desulfallas sp. Bu1-1]MBF7082905.1 MBL fold metallo-hydrolase [Desulfallas sp. Bu1-1]